MILQLFFCGGGKFKTTSGKFFEAYKLSRPLGKMKCLIVGNCPLKRKMRTNEDEIDAVIETQFF